MTASTTLTARSLLVIVLAVLPAVAQLASGDIGLVRWEDTTMAVVSGGTTVTVYPVTGLGGLQSNAAGGIIWDPTTANSFIVAGDLGIARVTITGPGSATTNVLATHPAGSWSRLVAWTPSGSLVFAYSLSPALWSLDPISGAVQPIPIASPAWSSVGAVVADAQTGDLFVGEGNGSSQGPSLFRVSGTTVTAIVANLNGFTSMIQDPATGDLLATSIAGGNLRVVRITQTGAVTDIIPPGTIIDLAGIDFDTNGDLLILSKLASTIYRVPAGGGLPLPQLLLLAYPMPTAMAVTGEIFALSVAAPMDGSLSLAVTNVPLPTVEGWTLFTTSTPTPLGQGPAFGIVPDATTLSIIAGFPFPAVGNFFHWLPGWPGVFPDVPVALPPGSTAPLSGQTWDFLGVALDATSQIAGATRPRRVTFP